MGGDEGARCGRGVRPDEGDDDGIVPSSTYCERPAKQTGGEHVGEARDGGPCEGPCELALAELALRLWNSKRGCCVLRVLILTPAIFLSQRPQFSYIFAP